jgi:hypothetical protein
VTDLSKFQNARLVREREECRAIAEQLTRIASNVRSVMEAASTPIYECPDLDEAYKLLAACACNVAEYR